MKILKSHLDEENRLVRFPSKHSAREAALEYLWYKFEDDKVYTQKEVNAILNENHTFSDPDLLRRELYNHHYLDRKSNGTEYRRETPEDKKSDT